MAAELQWEEALGDDGQVEEKNPCALRFLSGDDVATEDLQWEEVTEDDKDGEESTRSVLEALEAGDGEGPSFSTEENGALVKAACPELWEKFEEEERLRDEAKKERNKGKRATKSKASIEEDTMQRNLFSFFKTTKSGRGFVNAGACEMACSDPRALHHTSFVEVTKNRSLPRAPADNSLRPSMTLTKPKNVTKVVARQATLKTSNRRQVSQKAEKRGTQKAGKGGTQSLPTFLVKKGV
eukprot:TRINITY_DN15081_c0_g1_i2.p1 TRINITY_DN15081_c0_g1~~TRINITY_DN15081_c0_g1_i2.p1  ORF type:complete len:275 (+),score=68.84 TRINITY_DN15081_c0_g1_i2:109-825(+)